MERVLSDPQIFEVPKRRKGAEIGCGVRPFDGLEVRKPHKDVFSTPPGRAVLELESGWSIVWMALGHFEVRQMKCRLGSDLVQ